MYYTTQCCVLVLERFQFEIRQLNFHIIQLSMLAFAVREEEIQAFFDNGMLFIVLFNIDELLPPADFALTCR